ncbi:MAG: hypothetical protein JOY61_12530, partial [Chloroflexi bacterium]|nr:hypothetical protein [Chloroflexota bacterium]
MRYQCALALALLVLLVLLAAAPLTASAHPLGNFTVNRYSRVEVDRYGPHIKYVLDLAEVPSVQDTQAADLNHDGTVSDEEWQTYTAQRVEDVRRNLELTIDGAPVALSAENSSISHPIGQGNIPLIRIETTFVGAWSWPASDSSPHQATYRDRNEPSRLGWREIVVQASSGVQIDQSSVPSADITNELQNYPDRFLNDPLNVREASWEFAPGAPGAADQAPTTGSALGRPTDPFTQL